MLAVPVAAASTLVLNPSLRYQVFRAVSETPGVVTFFQLRSAVVRRDFESAAGALQRQLAWSLDYGLDQSVQVPSLIENTAFVINAAVLPSEQAALTPYLKKLAASYPALYRPQLWLGRALAPVSPEQALKSLEKAAAIVSTDEQIYRAALVAADKIGDRRLVTHWCERYRSATAGGSHPYQFNPLATGVGVRRVIAEFVRPSSGSALIEYNALTPGRENVLEFVLPAASEHREVVLHFGTVPSILLDFRKIVLMEKGVRTAQLSKELTFHSQHGYILDDRKILLAGAFGERLTVSWASQGSYRADRILAYVDVSRAPLSNLQGCWP